MEMLNTLLEAFGPVLIGLITVPAYGYVKKYIAWFDKRPAWAQRLLVVGVAIAISFLGSQLGLVLPEDLGLWTPETVEGVMSGILAIAVHAGNKNPSEPSG